MGIRRGIQVGWVLVVCIIAAVFLSREETLLHPLIDTTTIAVICVPISIVALYTKIKMGLSGSSAFLHLSIPTALLSSMMGTIQIMSWMDDPSALLIVIPILLLPFLYAAGLTMIGYFIEDKPSEEASKVNGWDIGFCMTVYTLTFLGGLVSSGTDMMSLLLLYSNPTALLLCGLCVGTSVIFANEQKELLEAISDGAFANAAVSVVASIILFFLSIGAPETIGASLLIGCFGLFYGLIIHIGCYLCALKRERIDRLNYGVKNWHLVELTSFFLFIFYAPPTMLEMFL